MSEAHACDYIVMHDVDLIPLNDNLSYSYPSDGPFHIASPKLHPKYHYKNFVGGILLINNIHFRQVQNINDREFSENNQIPGKILLLLSFPLYIYIGNENQSVMVSIYAIEKDLTETLQRKTMDLTCSAANG